MLFDVMTALRLYILVGKVDMTMEEVQFCFAQNSSYLA